MRLAYALPRIVRHFLPQSVTRFLLRRSWIIRAGLETVDAATAGRRYAEVLAASDTGLSGKRVLILGYGGRFDLGVQLLEAGAAFVALCDPYARPDNSHNRRFVRTHARYVTTARGGPRPHPGHMQLIEEDVRFLSVPIESERYDLVISNSVYEHLDDAAGVTRSLAQWTSRQGIHIHYVDLRDHFFKFPFEMLRYSEKTWRSWFNPSSNHNRLRVWDYRALFMRLFESVEIGVLERDAAGFASIRSEIRPEFISGDPDDDSVTLIRIIARAPRVGR